MSNHGRVFFSILLVGALASSASCASSAQREAERLEQSASWLATMDAVVHRWVLNRVPTRYAERTIREGQDQLRKAGQAGLSAKAARLGAMVHARDSAGLAGVLAELAADRSALEDRATKLKSQ